MYLQNQTITVYLSDTSKKFLNFRSLTRLETFPKEKLNMFLILLQRGSFVWKWQKRLAWTWQTNRQYLALKLKRKASKVFEPEKERKGSLYQCVSLREGGVGGGGGAISTTT
jgi:hypothetical protein